MTGSFQDAAALEDPELACLSNNIANRLASSQTALTEAKDDKVQTKQTELKWPKWKWRRRRTSQNPRRSRTGQARDVSELCVRRDTGAPNSERILSHLVSTRLLSDTHTEHMSWTHTYPEPEWPYCEFGFQSAHTVYLISPKSEKVLLFVCPRTVGLFSIWGGFYGKVLFGVLNVLPNWSFALTDLSSQLLIVRIFRPSSVLLQWVDWLGDSEPGLFRSGSVGDQQGLCLCVLR